MVLEHLLGREDFGADVARVAAGLEVDDVEVRLQRRLLGEAAVARLALEDLLLFVNWKKRSQCHSPEVRTNATKSQIQKKSYLVDASKGILNIIISQILGPPY